MLASTGMAQALFANQREANLQSTIALVEEVLTELGGAAFATDHDQVLLVAERSTLDLDRSEVRDLVLHVTTTADDHDDVLVARFGGKMGA